MFFTSSLFSFFYCLILYEINVNVQNENTSQWSIKSRIKKGHRQLNMTHVISYLNMNVHIAASWLSEIRHHRHWQRVLDRVSGCKLSMLTFTLPSHRSTVGGSMSLRGSNLSLACFHGINFRSKSWGLFTMDEPYITFITEAQEVVADGKIYTGT
jgi:hypothetical protein